MTTRNSLIAYEKAAEASHVEPFNDTEGSNILLRLTHLDLQSITN